jgi:rhodanese-related sulfurtransferase
MNDYMILWMKINLTKCFVIIIFSSLLGIFYNFFNPKGIPLISRPKEVKWATDSIVSSTLKTVDTVITKEKSLSQEKSSPDTKVETFTSIPKSDSIKNRRPKPETKVYKDEDEGFAEPIGINLEQSYKLFTMGFVFIDARVEEEYKTGHIKKAINVSLYDFDKYKNALSKVPKSETIICYCGGSDCDLSTQLANKLFSLGYRNIYIFIGGWEQWKTAGYPIE